MPDSSIDCCVTSPPYYALRDYGTVLDPFTGSGTTLMVAKDMGRKAVGFELNPDYCAIAAKRCQQLTVFGVNQ